MTQSAKEPPRYLIQAAANTLEVLLVFGREPHRFTLSEAAAQLQMDRNQVFRCLRTLSHVGFVRLDEDERFVLTPLVDQLATVSKPQTSLVGAAKAWMDDISHTTEETVNLFALDGDEMVCVDHRDGLRPVRLVAEFGRRAALHAGACPKAVLAYLPPERQDEVLGKLGQLPQLTPFTVNGAAALRREIEQIRARGYAISDLDVDVEARGVGAPIFDSAGHVIGAISVGGPASRMTPQRVAEFGDVITSAARLISRQLGYNGNMFSSREVSQ